MRGHVGLTLALAVPLLAGCVYGDESADYAARLTNGCEHRVSVDFTESSTYIMENGVGEDAVAADGTWDFMDAGEVDEIRPAEGQEAVFSATVFSDTEVLTVYWGDDAGKPNDHVLSGDECLPAVTDA